MMMMMIKIIIIIIIIVVVVIVIIIHVVHILATKICNVLYPINMDCFQIKFVNTRRKHHKRNMKEVAVFMRGFKLLYNY